MTKKSIGYVKLEWTCPNCGTRNPGPQKTCTSCGYPQPDDVEFEQAAGEELLKDQAEIAKAKKGPDIHCFYCGARNPADAKTCSQCGGDLTQGSRRKAGKVVGAHKKGPVGTITCQSCGSAVPAGAPKCPNCGASLSKPRPKPARAQSVPAKGMNKWVLFGGLALLLVAMLFCGFFLFSTKDLSGTVAGVTWKRSISIEAFGPVKHEDWREDIAANANIGVCTPKAHHTQDTPPADGSSAKEICGTPYTVDKGNGYGEVAQDCQYEVYKDWCSYTLNEWQVVDTVKSQGRDYNPQWPDTLSLSLNNNRREGARSEEYEIIFDAGGERYTYTTRDFNLFQQARPGSKWILTVNKLGGVTHIEQK